jgi:hypothetical protein
MVSLLDLPPLCRHLCLRNDRISVMALQRNGLPTRCGKLPCNDLERCDPLLFQQFPLAHGLRTVLPPSLASSLGRDISERDRCALLIPSAQNKRSRAGRYDHG